MNSWRLTCLLLTVALPSCVTSSSPPEPEPGAFTGSVLVMWVGEGGQSGDGRFLFVPDPRKPLTFKRPGNRKAAAIRPEMMYTDGGSIPRIAQIFNGLSPWGYAPAYMIHDWLFVARHCRLDGDPAYADASDLSFEDSYRVLDEAIATLVAERKVARNDVARSAITAAVASPVARKLWDRSGACADEKVRPEDVAAAEAAIPGSGRPHPPTGGPPADAGVTAVVVGRVGF